MKTHSYTSDTSPEAYELQLQLVREMEPLDRLRKAMALSRQVKQMSLDAIRRRHPDFDENEVRWKFLELTYGKTLAADVRRCQEERGLE
ncbi:MAG: hypothetical protein ACI9HK_000872 [Pirellulaceae bacterium]|jgi:hypothetical protein